MNEMRIYILGAGASKPDGVPLTHEFIKKVFDKFGGREEKKPSFHWLPFDRVSVIEPVLKRLDAYHGLNLFEEWQQYLTTGDRHEYPLEVGTEQIESFFTEICNKAASNSEDADILQKLRLLFFHTICHASIMTEGRNYRRFIDSVMRLSGKKYVISFNYDLLLENALMEKVGDESKDPLTFQDGKNIFEGVLPWRYGVEFSCLEEAIEFKFVSMDEAQIIYFKLHGSFNWT